MLCIAHRGAMGYAPENTLLSIQKAIDLGTDWIEIDVQLIDKKLLVFHDRKLDRTTNGHGYIAHYTFAELRELNAGLGQKIPTLDEVFQLINGRVGLNIELKEKGAALALASYLSQLPHFILHQDKLIISSFHMSELKKVKSFSPTFKIGVLAKKNKRAAFKWANKLKAYSIHFNLDAINKTTIDQAHQQGFQVYIYTVNEITDILHMQELGVDGVFCNFPDRALNLTITNFS